MCARSPAAICVVLLAAGCTFDTSGLHVPDLGSVGDLQEDQGISFADTKAEATADSQELFDLLPADILDSGFLQDTGTDTGPPLSPLGVDDGRLWLGLTGSGSTSLFSWFQATGSWSPEASAPPVTGEVYWVVEQLIPQSGVEVAAVRSVSGAARLLQLVRWTGSTWQVDVDLSSPGTQHADKRDYDLAREAISGDLLLVYGNNNSRPVYQVLSGSTWTAPASLPINDGSGPYPDLSSSPILWVELVSRPGTNEVALVYADSAGKLGTIVYSNSIWLTSTAQLLTSDLKINPTSGVTSNRAYDVAYTSQSGHLVVAWGVNSSDSVCYQVKPPDSSSVTKSSMNIVQGKVDFIDLDPDPASDRIAGAFVDMGGGTERLGLATWDSGAWVGVAEYDSQVRNFEDASTGDFPAAVGWVGHSGQAICVYADNSSGTLDWYQWTSGSWLAGGDVTIAGKGETESVLIRSTSLQDQLIAIIVDSNSTVYSATYDGTDWQPVNGTLITSGLSPLNAVPVDFQLRR